MNLIDLVCVLILGLYVLSGIYRGFLPTVLSIGANLFSWCASLLFMPLMANSVKANAGMFNMLLYYSEGSEFIGDLELARTPIDSVSSQQLASILKNSSLPFPFGKEIQHNVASKAFSGMDISSLGDYFNQTIVCVVINIIVFILLFALIRLVLGFVIGAFDYSRTLPTLRRHDALISAGFGLVRGVMALFVLFMLVPLVLLVMNFDFVHQMVAGSIFAPFFYHSNFLLAILPGA